MLGRSGKASFAAVPAHLPPNGRSARSAAGLDTQRYLRLFTWGFIGILFVASIVLGTRGSAITLVALAIGALVIGYLILLGQDVLVAGIIVGLGLFIDWFQLVAPPFRLPVVGTSVAAGFLVINFLRQSPEHPWISVPHFRWWILLLVLALLPGIRGGLLQGGRYYVTILLNALLLYMVGIQVAREIARIRQLFILLAGLASLIALHSVLQGETQSALLPTNYWDNYLLSVNYFRLVGSQALRAGSFFINPDINSAFLASMVFIPVSLFIESSSRFLKVVYAGEAALILIGLFFTYSIASFIATGAGLLVFILLAGRGRYRLYAFGLLGSLVAAIVAVFPALLRSFLDHVGTPGEFSLRLGAWETGVRVILAHPLTGLGLSFYIYETGSAPYRVALQPIPLAHPHNSFLELGALGGLPLLAAFLIVWVGAIWLMWRNYRQIDKKYQIFLSAGIASIVITTINSFAANPWTHPALVIFSWLILGALSSPALIPALRPGKSGERRSFSGARSRDSTAHALGSAQV